MLKGCFGDHLCEAGCDEAGRGCLAGPVFAAAVILPRNFIHPYLNDSKQLSEKERDEFRLVIEEQSVAWSVARIDNEEIDRINILNASIRAMHVAISRLKVRPEFLLIDGNRFKAYENIPHKCFVKGDATYMSIAAASVLAKTHRDQYMNELHEFHPEYNWKKNKAYATRDHRAAIRAHGLTPFHRKSFGLNPDQMVMELGE